MFNNRFLSNNNSVEIVQNVASPRVPVELAKALVAQFHQEDGPVCPGAAGKAQSKPDEVAPPERLDEGRNDNGRAVVVGDAANGGGR